MIEDDFYATVKLKTGEEIFARVVPSEEEEQMFLLVSSPVIVSEVKTRVGVVGYKLEPWLKTTTEDIFVLNLNDVLTMTESSDMEIITMYQTFIRQSYKMRNKEAKIDRRMGYIANVNDAKEILEKLYKNS